MPDLRIAILGAGAMGAIHAASDAHIAGASVVGVFSRIWHALITRPSGPALLDVDHAIDALSLSKATQRSLKQCESIRVFTIP